MNFKKIFAFLVLLTATSLCFAQDSSSMTGTVTDTTGALIPGAVVTLTNKLTGTTFKQTADKQGSYRFANVPPGTGYTVTFAHAGFATYKVDNVTLSIGVTRTQDAKLPAGASEVIEISAGSTAVTLDTTDAAIGNNIDVKTLNDLPVQDRTNGITTLFNLQPGVDNTNLGGSGSVTGARNDQSSVTVDGLDVNDIAAGTNFAIIASAPVDSVSQFTGTVGGLVPGLGTGAGGQFQLATKNGTNQFHGNINEYHRDTSTVANSYFNNLVGLPRTPLIRNQFGGNVAGPIVKNKLFFFFDFADSRIIQSGTAEVTVPYATYDSGAPVVNYINNGATCGSTSRLSNQPTCISSVNQTQAMALDPLGAGLNLPLLGFLNGRYPKPNDLTAGDGVNTGGFRFTSPTPDFQTTYIGRIDYNLSNSHKIFGRFTINRENSVYALPEFKGDPNSTNFIDRSYAYVVGDTWTIGKNKVNQFYYGDTISKLNFPASDFFTSPNVYSFSGLSNPYGTANSQQRRVPIPVVRDDFSWQIKSHDIYFGGLFKFIKTNSNSVYDYNFVGVGLQGSALSTGLATSERPADINGSSTAQVDYDQLYATALGVIGDISTNFDYNKAGVAAPGGSGGPRAYRYFETEAYVSDTWKVNKQLTLTYGLRYQLYSVPYEAHGDESISSIIGLTQRQSTFNAYMENRLAQSAAGVSGPTALPLFQEVLGGKANNAPSSYAPSYKDLAPRFALAYNPTWSRKTVFNAGAGLVYDRTVINAINFLQDQLSFLFYNNSTNQLGDLTSAPRLNACTTGSNCTGPTGLSYLSAANPTPQPITAGYVPYVSGGVPYGLAAGQVGFIISPNLRDPYNIEMNAGIQRELPFHMVLKVSYDGRLGRRLLADADASQVLDFPDFQSGQSLSQAFGSLTTQTRAGATTLTPQPWFEDVLGNYLGSCSGYALAAFGINVPNCTTLAAAGAGILAPRGDLGDMIQTLNYYGIMPQNVGVPAQFGTQAYLTNMASSNYNALLVTLNKNLSQGLKFDFNYTWSHSIDNNSQTANNNALYNATGIICDVTQPRACRGNSDFDVRQEISSDFTYELPVGRGKMFAGGDSHFVDEFIGGWAVSGLPAYRTGLSFNPLSDAFLASFAAEDPSIFMGSRKDLKMHVNKEQGYVYGFAGGLAGAQKVASEFRGPIGLEYGERNIGKGPGAFNLDMGLAKTFPIIPSKNLNLNFRADAFNILNHPNFSGPSTNLVGNASRFGQITGTSTDPRVAQFSLRLEF